LSGSEVRATVTNSTTSPVPVRADGFYGDYIDNNNGTHVYIRPTTSGEARITRTGTTTTFQPVRADGYFGDYVDVNAGTNLYLRPLSAGQVRFTSTGSTTNYVEGRALGYFGNYLDINGATGGTHVYIRPASGGEVKATVTGDTVTYVPVRASSFPTGSMAEYKQDIVPWEESALDLILASTIYEYRLKSEVAAGKDRLRQGLVIGAEYNTPKGVIDGDGVEQYLMNSWSWRGMQEMYERFDTRIKELESKLGVA
jgi:hypothetical protein